MRKGKKYMKEKKEKYKNKNEKAMKEREKKEGGSEAQKQGVIGGGRGLGEARRQELM